MPGVWLRKSQKRAIFKALLGMGVSSFEMLGPNASPERSGSVWRVRHGRPILKSAVVSAVSPDMRQRFRELVSAGINHVDLLLHVSEFRLQRTCPASPEGRAQAVVNRYKSALAMARDAGFSSVGIGLGDVFRSDITFVINVVGELSDQKPNHFLLYDTVGCALPTQVQMWIRKLSRITAVRLHGHFHNDLGLATANTVMAIQAGASGADVTVGGVGDRAGNASLEQVALIVEHFLKRPTGINLALTTSTAGKILRAFGIADTRRLPVVGDFAFVHSAPSHYQVLASGEHRAYEAYPPGLVGQKRRYEVSDALAIARALGSSWTGEGKSLSVLRRRLREHRGHILSEDELRRLLA